MTAPAAPPDEGAFLARGWVKFPHDDALAAWAADADRAARAAEADPPVGQLRCGGTWYVGVNALQNDAAGRLPGGPALAGAAIEAARALCGGAVALDRAQASICHPGYPAPGAEESAAAFRYRRDRDAAHVDGLLRTPPGRSRRLGEAHAFILGVPLNDPPAGAAPFVIWEGSHHVMRAAFAAAYAGVPPERWPEIDVTDAYHTARRRCFETLKRVELPARRGEAYLVHRLALHGVAPWRAGPGRRAIAYFRPNPWPDSDFGWWLTRP